MTGNRRPIRRGSWASHLRRVALVAVLAIISSAMLPFVHSATSHAGDCAVCYVFTHLGDSVADVAVQQGFPTPASSSSRESREPAILVSLPVLDSSEARAPPGPSVSI